MLGNNRKPTYVGQKTSVPTVPNLEGVYCIAIFKCKFNNHQNLSTTNDSNRFRICFNGKWIGEKHICKYDKTPTTYFNFISAANVIPIMIIVLTSITITIASLYIWSQFKQWKLRTKFKQNQKINNTEQNEF